MFILDRSHAPKETRGEGNGGDKGKPPEAFCMFGRDCGGWRSREPFPAEIFPCQSKSSILTQIDSGKEKEPTAKAWECPVPSFPPGCSRVLCCNTEDTWNPTDHVDRRRRHIHMMVAHMHNKRKPRVASFPEHKILCFCYCFPKHVYIHNNNGSQWHSRWHGAAWRDERADAS